jgi:hypothetical protein
MFCIFNEETLLNVGGTLSKEPGRVKKTIRPIFRGFRDGRFANEMPLASRGRMEYRPRFLWFSIF